MVFLNCVRVQIYTMRIHIRKIIVWNPSLGDSIITLMKILFSASIRTDGSSRFQKITVGVLLVCRCQLENFTRKVYAEFDLDF